MATGIIVDRTLPTPFGFDHLGQRRHLGLLPSGDGLLALPRYADHFPVIPRSQWKDISFAGYRVPIMDQRQTNSCGGHASAGAHWGLYLTTGQPPVEFSPTFVYALANGGQDAGMSLEDGLTVLTKYGNCLASECPEGQIDGSQIPQSALATAARFRVRKAYRAHSFDEIASGHLRAHFPFFGIFVDPSEFHNFDAEGVPPAHAFQANHAVRSDGLRRLPSGRWSLDGINSWSKKWGGLGGRMQLVEDHIHADCSAIVLVDVLSDPQATAGASSSPEAAYPSGGNTP